MVGVNPFWSSVAFDIEFSHLICSTNQLTGFYIECNTYLKWVKRLLQRFHCELFPITLNSTIIFFIPDKLHTLTRLIIREINFRESRDFLSFSGK